VDEELHRPAVICLRRVLEMLQREADLHRRQRRSLIPEWQARADRLDDVDDRRADDGGVGRVVHERLVAGTAAGQ
jgi:hypothetical protein